MNRTTRIVLICGIVLLGASAVIVAVFFRGDEYVVVIHNGSAHALTDVHVKGGGDDEQLGTIVPDETIKHSFRIAQDGKLELTGHGENVNGPGEFSKVIDTHVYRDREGMATVNVDSDGDVSAISEKGN